MTKRFDLRAVAMNPTQLIAERCSKDLTPQCRSIEVRFRMYEGSPSPTADIEIKVSMLDAICGTCKSFEEKQE